MTLIAHNVTPMGTPAVPTSNVFPYLHPAHRPYTSVTEANTIVVPAMRFIGLTVNINAKEYWYKDGVADIDLVEKHVMPTLKYIVVTASRNLLDSDEGNVLLVKNSSVVLTALTTLSPTFNCCVTPQEGYDATIAGGLGVTFDDPNGLAVAENEMISIGRIGDEFIIRP